MLKKSFQIRYQLEQLLDGAIAAGAFTLAIFIRKWLGVRYPDTFPQISHFESLSWLYLLIVPLWMFMLEMSDLYQYRSVRTSTKTISAILKANLLGIMIAFFVLYILKIKEIPRTLIFTHALLDILLMFGKEMLMRRLEFLWVTRPNILFVGAPKDFREIKTRFDQVPQWKPNLLGILVPSSVKKNKTEDEIKQEVATFLDNVTYKGSSSELIEVLHTESVDYVALNPREEHFEEIQKTINTCETEGVETWLVADFFRTSIARPQLDEFQDLPMIIFRTTPSVSWAFIFKRIIDIVGSFLLITLLSPIMLVIVLAIKCSSPGPIVFKQQRCTVHGRVFWMYKFRTMVADAEAIREELGAENEMSGPVFKMRDDPRITKLGRLLRRHSLDELPQLFNVFTGKMSLVGPRPPIPEEVAHYENWQRRRLSMRSGITCIWQVSGRNALPFEEWMKLDLQYIDTWSLALDFKILMKTPLAALRGTGY